MQTAYMERRSDLSSPLTIYTRMIDPESACDIGMHLPRLRELAHGDVFEIGVRGGASTAALILGIMQHRGHLYSVDINPHCGTEVFEPMHSWTFICGHSTNDAARILTQIPPVLDVLFIDGEHDYPQVCKELVIYGSLVKKGGVILLHDTELQGAGVRQAVTEYAKAVGAKLELISGCYGLGCLWI